MDSRKRRIRVGLCALHLRYELISSKTQLSRFDSQMPSVSRWTVTGDIALVQLKNPVDLTSFGKFLITL